MQHSLGYLYLKFALISIVSFFASIALCCGLYLLLIKIYPPYTEEGYGVMPMFQTFFSMFVSFIAFVILYYKLWIKYELIRKWLVSKFKK